MLLARLAARVRVARAVVGRAFAGNANFAGLSNFVVATRRAALGIGGPRLGKAALGLDLSPEQIWPMDLHARPPEQSTLSSRTTAAPSQLCTNTAIITRLAMTPVAKVTEREAVRK